MRQRITPAERSVLELLAQGYSKKQICELKNYKLTTVKTLLRRVFQSLEVAKEEDAIKKFLASIEINCNDTQITHQNLNDRSN